MKKKLVKALLVTGSLLLSNPAHALFINGGFETGDFTGWNISGTGASLSSVISASSPMLIGQTTDIDPYYGSYMARLQDLDGYYHTTTLSQTATISSTDLTETLYVRWGALLVEPSNSHPVGDQPKFGINILRNGISIGAFQADALNKQGGGWADYGNYDGEAWYKTGLFTFGLSSYGVGDTITVTMTVNDCGWGGHGGAAFLDGIGTAPLPSVPVPGAIWLLGSGLAGLVGMTRKRVRNA